MRTTSAQAERIIRVGEVIARNGIAAAAVDVLLLAHDARDLGIDSVLVDALVDESAPEVVRQRAFVLIGRRMASISGQTADVVVTPSAAGQSFRVAAAH